MAWADRLRKVREGLAPPAEQPVPAPVLVPVAVPPSPEEAPAAVAIAVVPAPDGEAPPADAPEPELDLVAASQRLAPFLDRVRAELAGQYSKPLKWPEGGRLVPYPSHWATYRDRFPAELADVLRPLAEAWRAGDRPLADGWPAAPELYQFEYSRLVAWFKARPAEVPQQVAAWEGSITERRNPLHDLGKKVEPAEAERQQKAPEPEPEPETWGERSNLIAQLEQLRPDDLPPTFQLRPGVTVTDGPRFLAGLKAEAEAGPGGLRARRGLLLADVADLFRAIADYRRPIGFSVKPTRHTAGLPQRRAGMSPADHLAELGGYQGAQRHAGEYAHLLWDAARLWQRDQGLPSATRWERQYWTMWEKAQAPR